MTHELGHLYGLHDRYTASGCNPNDYSVMDASVCDGGYPTYIDLGRMNYSDTYGGTYLATSTTASGGTMYTQWQDRTWNDLVVRFKRYKWVGISWQYQQTVESYDNIGTHYDSDPRTIYHSWYTGGGGYWYKICTHGWVGTQDNGVQVESVGGCSAGIFIS